MAWLKVAEFAEEQSVSPSTVRNWIKDGMPSATGPCGVIVVDPEAAEEWLDAHSAEPDEEPEVLVEENDGELDEDELDVEDEDDEEE